MTPLDARLTADPATAQDVTWIEPFDSWARSHNLIPVGSQLVFTASKDGRTYVFFVDMSIPNIIPDGVDPETFMRSTWLASAEVERGKCRDMGWTTRRPSRPRPTHEPHTQG